MRRLDFGWFVRPGEETLTGRPRIEPCLGYVVAHRQGVLLFDSGMGSHPDVDAHYRPRRVPLDQALATAGLTTDEVGAVANCHLHFDHCGGNHQLVGRPVFVQSVELDQARTTSDYTLPDLLDGSAFEHISGEAEIWDGVWLIPTPGHTAGHQSLVVRRDDGVVVVAGQSHDTASEYAADVLALSAARSDRDPTLPGVPAWIDRLQRFDPKAVYFAHDHAVWKP